MKKVLVTGGCGFIGSHLTEKLIELGYEVTIIDNLSTGRLENIKKFKKKLKFFKLDIIEKNKIEKYFKNIDIVFHCAALADIVPSIQQPKNYYESNVTGSFNIVSCCMKHKIKKLVYTASSSCYGITKKFPTLEDEKINPEYPYALTKYLGEQIILHWSKVYNLSCISLRLFNVYGPRSRTSGTYGAMFGTFLAQKLSKKPFTIVGDGKQRRDFTYISDIVSALIKASKSKISGEIFNVGSGKSISVNYIIKLLKGDKIRIPKRPGEPEVTYANINKIKRKLKWRPKVKIEEGVNLLLNNINYWKKAPVWTPKKIKIATKDWFKYLG
jgi:UDP-glucose 4-epimerase|tara:strand:+ start:477 stop:1457 length:981 start_codon:yes stop_codon:yes gene_type:complete